jgi:PD-(D/E)XK nuclease superfamily
VTNCVACGGAMDPVDVGEVTHASCLMVDELTDDHPFNVMLKQRLTEIITWYDKENPRAKQSAIGPSEIGDPCDRRIGYRLANIPIINDRVDPWAGIVGTALHSWLEKAVAAWGDFQGTSEWWTETTLRHDFMEGHADLYNTRYEAVIDWKSASKDIIAQAKNHGPSPGYKIQTQMYGYLFEQAGRPVKRVSLVFLPRAGWLYEMYVWSAPYDRSVAENALNRMFGIAQQVLDLDVLNKSHRWEQIDATPGKGCGFCPWFEARRDPERAADDTGCPGPG